MGKASTVEVLLKYGADASICNKENESPSDSTGDVGIKEMLRDRGGEPLSY
jgi:hypothetical protein